MAWEYSEKTKQLFLDAVPGKPGTHLGESENPDDLGEHGSIACGDAMRFTFRVERDPTDATQDVIVAVKMEPRRPRPCLPRSGLYNWTVYRTRTEAGTWVRKKNGCMSSDD
jgi:hypothetical protein